MPLPPSKTWCLLWAKGKDGWFCGAFAMDQYSDEFDPETLQLLTRAFDLARKVASLRGTSPEEIGAAALANFKRLFRLGPVDKG